MDSNNINSNMKDMTVEALARETASASPAPGGGSISAMAGAFSAALAGMVAKLSLEKKGYEHLQEDMRRLDAEAEALRLDLLEDIQKDSSSFDAYMQALKLPKQTEAQQASRSQAMQDALKGACEVPLKVAGKALRALELSAYAVREGNINAASDAMSGVLLGRAAVLGALANVRINLGGIRDEAYKQKMRQQCDRLEQAANRVEAESDKALHAR